ncbi:Protein of unknown function [Cohaesibacter sp. ES.047]|uniref:DUF3592 domain-containing protein n=1 Tax=Cohaesibacter sp. ES.047 TaxID=1798205 RepID=UPI000BB908F4|nr:DUF3592 domain-containing protein [Cohaesibacter sp. ES.047]SNY92766.1 Protein of unknown function [Cohaesibacter sp. ES.047]
MTDANTSNSRTPSLAAFLFLAIAIGGFVYAGLGFIGLSEAQIPDGWKSTPGQVMESGVEIIKGTNSDGETYRPTIRYRYEVDGSFLFGNQIKRHQQERTLKGVAETEIEDLKQGTNVTVHYNPADPSEAVIMKSDTIGPMQAISAGLCIGITCFAIFIVSLRKRQTAKSATA